MKYSSKRISYNFIPICIIFVLAILFSPSFSSFKEGNTTTTTNTNNNNNTNNNTNNNNNTNDIYQNLLQNQQATQNRQQLIAERNTFFPKQLDTETTNARLDYTTLDVKSINIQLVILSILAVITTIILITTLYQ